MFIDEYREYCLSLGADVEEKTPFVKFKNGEGVLVFYVCGHMFAFFDCNDYHVISLKCQPERIDELKAQHDCIGNPYNESPKHWIGIDPHTAPDDLLRKLTRNSYEIVKAKYSKIAGSRKKIRKHIYLAGGCFWGTEHFFKQIAGVIETEVGFANGQTDNPTYELVYTDTTGYAETVHVVYDPDKVSLEFLLRMFFVAVDPTSLNKQGHDEGTRYRTGIYYTDAIDLPTIDRVYAAEQSKYEQPLVVEKLPLQNFYPADEYHQDYLDKHPDGYCHLPKALFEFARQAKETK